MVYLGFTLGCTFSTNMGMFIAFRLLSGCAGSCPLALCGGTLADVIPRESRGKWMGLFVMGPLLGPVIGPIAGGFVAQSIGWRWVFRIILIAVRSSYLALHSQNQKKLAAEWLILRDLLIVRCRLHVRHHLSPRD